MITGTKDLFNFTIYLAYILLFVLVSMYVFVANDESQPIIEIFQLNYFVPVFIYALGTVGLSLIIFLALRKKLNRLIAFIISIVIGLPVGIKMMIAIFTRLSGF